MQRYVVTGATGLIGRALVSKLCEFGEVFAVVRAARSLAPPVKEVVLDLADPAFDRALPTQADAVVHLAQARAFAQFPDSARDVFDVNLGSTSRLLDWARRSGVRAFVFASSGGIYAPSPHPHKEEEPPAFTGRLGYYYATRHAAEILALTYAEYFTPIGLRFFFVYGPGQAANMLMPRLICSVIDRKPLQLQGNDGLRFNPVHVSDAVQAVLAAIGLDRSAIVNVAGPQVLTLRKAGEIIGAHLGVEPRFELIGGDPIDLIGDTARQCKLLIQPHILFRDGIGEQCRDILERSRNRTCEIN